MFFFFLVKYTHLDLEFNLKFQIVKIYNKITKRKTFKRDLPNNYRSSDSNTLCVTISLQNEAPETWRWIKASQYTTHIYTNMRVRKCARMFIMIMIVNRSWSSSDRTYKPRKIESSQKQRLQSYAILKRKKEKYYI